MVWPTLGSRTAKEQNRTISGRAKARDFKFYIRVDHVKYQHTCDKVLEGNTLMFGDTRISLSVIGGIKPPCQNQLDVSCRFDTIPASAACDRQTDGQTDTRRQHIPRLRSVARSNKIFTISTAILYTFIRNECRNIQN